MSSFVYITRIPLIHIFRKRISATLIRQSIATEIVGLGEENLETFCTSFMKHRPTTSTKSYVVNWSEREAARLSMKCYQTFVEDAEVLKNFSKINFISVQIYYFCLNCFSHLIEHRKNIHKCY